MNMSEKIYRNVKALAAMDGIDLKDVEAKVEKSAGYLSRKRTRIDVDTLVRLAEVFEVSPEDLMGNDYEHELKKKNVMDELAYAAIAASEYFNEDGIVTFVQNQLRESQVKK